MIHFTDLTGLASSVIVIVALALQLPGVAHLKKSRLAWLLGTLTLLILIPFNGLPLAAYLRGWMGDLSITSLSLLIPVMLRPFINLPPPLARNKTATLLLIVLAACWLYPQALGIGMVDPYRLGYGSYQMIGGLLLISLIALYRQHIVIALIPALAIFAWAVGWYESTNLWDYLLDPLLAIYALGVLIKQALWVRIYSYSRGDQ
jgi:hypothetical protein